MIEVSCAIIIKEGKVLLTQRSESMPHAFEWEFPGGKLYPGESPERCIKREIREELNVDVSVDQLLPSVIHDYGSGRIKLIPFVCSLESGEIKLQQHRAFAWVEKKEMQKYNILKADLEVIRRLNGQWT